MGSVADPPSLDFPFSSSEPLLLRPRVSPDPIPASPDGAKDDRFDLMPGFRSGDMVWGKVKSHPWWPGQIYNEHFALPPVMASKVEGFVLVAFFGDNSYGWLDPADLLPFDPHFAEKSRQSNSHSFVNAVGEAIYEVSRRGALGLACFCRSLSNFRPTNLPGYIAVDVAGFEPGWIYSVEQIETARESIRPVQVLSFVQELAVRPLSDDLDLDWIKRKAMLLAYRRAIFTECDETYDQAFDRDQMFSSKEASGVRGRPDRFAIREEGKLPSAKKTKKKHMVNGKDEILAPNQRRESNGHSTTPAQVPTIAVVPGPIGHHASKASNQLLLTSSDVPKLKLEYTHEKAPDLIKQDDPPKPKPMAMAIDRGDNKELVGPPFSTISSAMVKKVQVPKRILEDPKPKNIEKKIKGELPQENDSTHQTPEQYMELPHLVSDLRSLAIDPLHGGERNVPAIVTPIFHRFRALVYQKSLIQRGDPIDRKRGNSDRQEELSTKRNKKLEALKELSTKKRVEYGQKMPLENKTRSEKESHRPSKKLEPNQLEETRRLKPPTPTFLVMKFETGAKMPSVPSLKVRFARFGQIDAARTRVYLESRTCKVLYKFKSDAEVAFKYAEKNTLFGEAKVKYYLRPVIVAAAGTKQHEVVTVDSVGLLRPISPIQQKRQPSLPRSPIQQQRQPLPEAEKKQPEVVRDDSVSLLRPRSPTQHTLPPKPCLKKLIQEAAAVKERSRVRFKVDPPPCPTGRKEWHIAPPLAPPRPPLLHKPRHRVQVQTPPPPLPLTRLCPMDKTDGGDRKEIDISDELMSLLLRCSGVVAAVNTSLGYVAYHPI